MREVGDEGRCPSHSPEFTWQNEAVNLIGVFGDEGDKSGG